MKNYPGPKSIYTIHSCAGNPNAQTHPVSVPSCLLAFFLYTDRLSVDVCQGPCLRASSSVLVFVNFTLSTVLGVLHIDSNNIG